MAPKRAPEFDALADHIAKLQGLGLLMDRAGNGHGNAMVEHFLETIRADPLWHRHRRTCRDAEIAIYWKKSRRVP